MTTNGLTDLQREAKLCWEESQAAGVAFSAHARAKGLNVRAVYDAVAQLRRRGLLPPGEPRKVGAGLKARAAASFAKVRVQAIASPVVGMPPLRLWLSMANGRRAELELRDAKALAAVLAELDAAG